MHAIKWSASVCLLLGFFHASAHADWLVKQVLQKGSDSTLDRVIETLAVESREAPSPPPTTYPVIVRENPWIVLEGATQNASETQATEHVYRETLFPNSTDLTLFQVDSIDAELFRLAEIRTLAQQGPVKNRIDLTIVGDGYTESERDKFFADAERIRQDLFGSSTFHTYLPLFNVHAVFVPSRQSGLTDVKKIDTALGLYRTPAGSKRAIMVGNASAAEKAISLAPDTDYPILLANDDFYGGLGGRYAITTRSVDSGKIVLRHELGHNFGEVGEEYDGGMVYTGANHATSPLGSRGWPQWASSGAKTFDCKYLNGDYVWKSLAQGPYRSSFKFPAPTQTGPYKLDIQMSSVGWDSPGSVEVRLDGQPVRYEGVYTKDRSFFRVALDRSVAPGTHILEVAQANQVGDRVLAFANIYALPATYDTQPDLIGGFQTFDQNGRSRGYRPTHASCLMRDMRQAKFCPVDIENMWLQFFKRVQLIDAVELTPEHVTVRYPMLSGLTFAWYRKDEASKKFLLLDFPADASRLVRNGLRPGRYKVVATFRTSEIRKASPVSTQEFDVPTRTLSAEL